MNSNKLDIGFWFPRPERGARLAQELRNRGHRVTLYHKLSIPGEQTNVIKVNTSFIKGIQMLRSLNHDVLYTSRSFKPVLQLYFNSLISKTPYIYTVNGAIWAYYKERSQGSILSLFKQSLYPFLFKIALHGASSLIANSRFLAQELKKRYPGNDLKIQHIYNGIDYESIDTGKPKPGAWPTEGNRIISVVTINLEKKIEGVLLLLEAFEKLAKKDPNVSYLIAAKSENRLAEEKLISRISKIPYRDRIRLIIDSKEISNLLASADIFVYATPPDSSDSIPRAVLEAIAAGVPVVNTSTTGLPELAISNDIPILVNYDSTDIANATESLLSSRRISKELLNNASLEIRKKFNWQYMAQEYEQRFYHAIKNK